MALPIWPAPFAARWKALSDGFACAAKSPK
jgi:hypothetical protein